MTALQTVKHHSYCHFKPSELPPLDRCKAHRIGDSDVGRATAAAAEACGADWHGMDDVCGSIWLNMGKPLIKQ